MKVVCDTGPLQYLVLIGCESILPLIFDQVLTARVVTERELRDPSTPQPVRQWAANPPSWIPIQEPVHLEDIPSLGISGVRGDGDRAIISLALEESAEFVLMDDLKARKAARKLNLEPIWTLEVLDEAAERGLIDDLPYRLDILEHQTLFYVGKAARQVIEDMKARDGKRRSEG